MRIDLLLLFLLIFILKINWCNGDLENSKKNEEKGKSLLVNEKNEKLENEKEDKENPKEEGDWTVVTRGRRWKKSRNLINSVNAFEQKKEIIKSTEDIKTINNLEPQESKVEENMKFCQLVNTTKNAQKFINNLKNKKQNGKLNKKNSFTNLEKIGSLELQEVEKENSNGEKSNGNFANVVNQIMNAKKFTNILTKKQIEKKVKQIQEVYEQQPFIFKWWDKVKANKKKVISSFIVFLLGVMELNADLINKDKFDSDWDDELIATQKFMPYKEELNREKRSTAILECKLVDKEIKDSIEYFTNCNFEETNPNEVKGILYENIEEVKKFLYEGKC